MNNGSADRTAAWVLFATILPSSMGFIDGSALNVALPTIQHDLGSSGPQLLWIISGYTLMLASLILLGGTLGDKLGRRRVFSWGILIFTVGSATCAASPTSDFLIGARLLQGIGGALMIPGSLSIISTYFPPDRRGRAIGTWSAATTITTAGGPVLGGVLAQAGLWRVVFLINLPLGIAALIALLARVPESVREHDDGRIDFVGAASVTIALAALAFGFISAPSAGFGSPLVVLSLAVGVAATALFVLTERRNPTPMVSLSVFRNTVFTGANLATLFLYGALTVFTFFLPLTMVQSQGYTESAAGLTLLPFALFLAGMSRWAGRLADRIGPRALLLIGPTIVGIGFLATALGAEATGARSYWTTYFPGIVLFGIGMGTTVAPLTTTVMSALSGELSGTASGINNAITRVAAVLALAVLGAVALLHFGGLVTAGAASLPLSAAQRANLAAEVANLGNTTVPPGVIGATAARLTSLINRSFLATFHLIVYICAGGAWLAALVSALLLKGTRLVRREERV